MIWVMASVGTMHPVVQTPSQTIHSKLLIAFVEALEQHFLGIGFSIAVCISQEQDLGSCSNQNAVSPCQKSIREIESLGK